MIEPQNTMTEELDAEKSVGLILSILRSGHSVELPASGYSMFPVLRPGDIVTVNPIPDVSFFEPGIVVVFRKENNLIMHRLVKLTESRRGEITIETQGDSLIKKDQPVSIENYYGIAISFKRNGKEHRIRKVIPSVSRYRFNHSLLWFAGKVKKVLR